MGLLFRPPPLHQPAAVIECRLGHHCVFLTKVHEHNLSHGGVSSPWAHLGEPHTTGPNLLPYSPPHPTQATELDGKAWRPTRAKWSPAWRQSCPRLFMAGHSTSANTRVLGSQKVPRGFCPWRRGAITDIPRGVLHLTSRFATLPV
jgi:hypothetical protein